MHVDSWYLRPLSLEDFAAGGSLLLIGLLSMALYIVVLRVMKRQDKEIVGYRFLVSVGITDLFLLFNYGVWPGLTILFKSEIVTPWMRSWIQIYLDWIWFSMVWHYTLVGWSRWSAIRRPHAFRNQTRRYSYLLCSMYYIIAMVQVLSTHFQSWYVTFYYEPSTYGMLAEDFDLYLKGGQSAMFLAFHVAAIVPPIVFYTWSVVLLIRRRRSSVVTATTINHAHNNIESRLLLPCLINMIMFIFGQVVITYGTGEGKWAGWTVMLLFCANSVLNPLLLLICSVSIRKQVFAEVGIRRNSYSDKLNDTLIYRNQLALQSEMSKSAIMETAMDDSCRESVVYV